MVTVRARPQRFVTRTVVMLNAACRRDKHCFCRGGGGAYCLHVGRTTGACGPSFDRSRRAVRFQSLQPVTQVLRNQFTLPHPSRPKLPCPLPVARVADSEGIERNISRYLQSKLDCEARLQTTAPSSSTSSGGGLRVVSTISIGIRRLRNCVTTRVIVNDSPVRRN